MINTNSFYAKLKELIENDDVNGVRTALNANGTVPRGRLSIILGIAVRRVSTDMVLLLTSHFLSTYDTIPPLSFLGLH